MLEKRSAGCLVKLLAGCHDVSPKTYRIIVISDEQSHPSGLLGLPGPNIGTRDYMINVASAQHGVGYGNWTHIDGFSENVLRYIRAVERQEHFDRGEIYDDA